MTTLEASSLTALVPGDVDGLEALSRRLTALAEGADHAGGAVQELDAAGWQGTAADAFRARRDQMPGVLQDAAAAFSAVAAVLAAVAVEIEDARRQVRQAQARWDDADAESRRWRRDLAAWEALGSARPGGPGLAPADIDPGAVGRLAAESSLTAARDRVRETTERAAAVVRRAAAAAPSGPSWASRARDVYASYYGGIGDSLRSLGEQLWFASDLAWGVDPAGVMRHRRETAAGFAGAVTDPVGALLAAVDLQTWREDPARATGRLVPELLLSALTGGAATGAATARRMADAPEPWTGPHGEHLSAEDNAAVVSWHQRAQSAEPLLTARMLELVAGVPGARLVGLEHRVKDLDSLRGKVARDLAEIGTSVENVLSRINDGVRYTVVADTDRYADVVTDGFNRLRDGTVPVRPPKLLWSDPDRYAGINSTWRPPEPDWPFEVQFHTPESHHAKEEEHAVYEQKRRMFPQDPLLEELNEQGRRIYRRVPRPAGVEHIVLSNPHG